MNPVIMVLTLFAGGYLLGSIPFGLILTRMAGATDPRGIGSGSIGATNVLRTGRKGLAALTLLLDAAKAAIAALTAGAIAGPNAALLAAAGAFVGHLFPIWLGFKGGKGVAVYVGILLGLFWPGLLFFAAVWLIVAYARRYSSLAALTASLLTPFFVWSQGRTELAALCAFLTLLLFFMHRTNIQRLLSGTESRIGQKAKETVG
ncbi:MAG: glycerol-3-phosphate 1-O-acyltransferase PlsY [Alphaproteobacteria bacterium]|nr:glycerol-3-phosphate 1-O-acyltransferase PlsY [Alphaproteobacteria bacterium]